MNASSSNADSTAEALRFFTSIAEKHGLRFSYETPPYVELIFKMPEQDGLEFPLTLTFQDIDEIHIYVADAHFSCFPFADARKRIEFESAVDGLIVGTHRVVRFSRPWSPAIVKARLQALRDGVWVTEWSYFFTFWPFAPLRSRIIRNTQKADSPRELPATG